MRVTAVRNASGLFKKGPPKTQKVGTGPLTKAFPAKTAQSIAEDWSGRSSDRPFYAGLKTGVSTDDARHEVVIPAPDDPGRHQGARRQRRGVRAVQIHDGIDVGGLPV